MNRKELDYILTENVKILIHLQAQSVKGLELSQIEFSINYLCCAGTKRRSNAFKDVKKSIQILILKLIEFKICLFASPLIMITFGFYFQYDGGSVFVSSCKPQLIT